MATTTPDALFSPLTAGAFDLSHRVILPAMSHRQAGPAPGVPSELTMRHYAQRATSGGLLVTEECWIHREGHDDAREPGLYTPEQVNAWRNVTSAVQAKGGIILAQLGLPGLAGPADVVVNTFDVDATLRKFRDAAESAGDAGFDGVELSGRVPELFFRSSSNKRTDEYGGDIQNRIRFLLDLAYTLGGVWSPGKVGVRLSAIEPLSSHIYGSELDGLRAAVSALFESGVAYVHIGVPWPSHQSHSMAMVMETLTALRTDSSRPTGVLIGSGGFTGDTARAAIQAGAIEAVGFGRSFISNPDLVRRLESGTSLEP